MKGVDFGPRGEVRDNVELSQQLANDFAGVVSRAQLVELAHDLRQRVLGLHDRLLGVVLPLFFQTPRVLGEFLAEELRETLTGWADSRPGVTNHLDACKT